MGPVMVGRQDLRVGLLLVGVVAAVALVPCGSAAHNRLAVAAPRQPSTQATMRREARSTASHSQTLR